MLRRRVEMNDYKIGASILGKTQAVRPVLRGNSHMLHMARLPQRIAQKTKGTNISECAVAQRNSNWAWSIEGRPMSKAFEGVQ